MLILVGVTLASALGWLIGLCCSPSAARRHLVLSSTLVACLLLPIVMSVRSSTDWTLLAVPTPVRGDKAEPIATASPIAVSSSQRVAALPAPAQEQAATESGTHPLAEVSGRATVNDNTNPPSPDRRPPRAEALCANSDDSRQPASSAAAVPASGVSAAAWAWSVYAVVAALLLVRMLGGLVSAQLIRRRATKIDTLSGGIQVLEADVPVPLALGFGASAIVLPSGLHQTLPPAALQDVLAHEAEHLRRGDHWQLLLQRIAAAAYWPIVSVHLLNRALTRACEELCDNAVLVGRDPVAYGQTLLAVAQRTVGGRAFVNPLTSTMIGRGELERRVAALLDVRRDPRTRVGRARWAYAAGLLTLAVLVATTRAVGIADEPRPSASSSGQSKPEPAAPKNDISWIGVPKVDRDNPAVQRGVVLGPDGKPLPGAAVYAVPDEGLTGFKFALPDRLSVKDLGPQRAVTDAQGRFEFTASDLMFITYAGKRARVETLLVATKDGLAPGWFRAWGEVVPDYVHIFDLEGDDDILLRTRSAATLRGRLEFEPGRPIVGARVEVVTLLAPIDYDLAQHLERQERIPHAVHDGIKYAAGLNWPRILGPATVTTTDAQGRFELSDLPEGFIATLEVTHPGAVTTQLRVAIRAIEPIREDPSLVPGPLTLYGSGFTARLAKGITLSGRAVHHHDPLAPPTPAVPAAGVTIAVGNPGAGNPGFPEAFLTQRFFTDADGNFTVTGLSDRTEGYDLAFVGSFAAPYYSRRWHVPHEQPVPPGYLPRRIGQPEVDLVPAVRYRLRITDPAGRPVDRNVSSAFVQREPGELRRDVQSQFNRPERVAPGVYEGIVPAGPAVVMVWREFVTDRPAAVDPKAFFAPGRTDWTPEEEQYAYGDAWRIALPATALCDLCHPNLNPTRDQRFLAAALFTNAKDTDEVLELQATVYSDPPVTVTLVDEAGQAVERASFERQIKEFNDFRGDVLPEDVRNELPATFSVYGLHPERAESLSFRRQERGLVGTLTTKWTDERLRVVMRPEPIAARLTGRLVDRSGKLSVDVGLRLKIEGAPEDGFITNGWNGNERTPFNVTVPPGVEIQGQFVRVRKDWHVRSPSLGTALGPLTVKAGETLDLGPIIVP